MVKKEKHWAIESHLIRALFLLSSFLYFYIFLSSLFAAHHNFYCYFHFHHYTLTKQSPLPSSFIHFVSLVDCIPFSAIVPWLVHVIPAHSITNSFVMNISICVSGLFFSSPPTSLYGDVRNTTDCQTCLVLRQVFFLSLLFRVMHFASGNPSATMAYAL